MFRCTNVRVVVPATLIISALLVSTGTSSSFREVRLRDDCDPDTFNLLRPGLCIGNGDTTVDEFNIELAQRGGVRFWKFQNDHFNMNASEPLLVVNRGGETHTFTKVAGFGGGFVAGLNAGSGNLVPAPECASFAADGVTLVPAPASATNVAVPAQTQFVAQRQTPGIVRYQCCIHPWMRTTVTVRNR